MSQNRGSIGDPRLAWFRALPFGAFLILIVAFWGAHASSPGSAPTPPATLAETGLYADPEGLVVGPNNLAFSPQYPLWTDGAAKSRWIFLPPDTAIDATDPDAWVFPVGTRLWKEFSFSGRPVETRYMQRLADGSWMYASYEWDADGRGAVLVPETGIRFAYQLTSTRAHAIPGTVDCKVCHGGGPSEVLGFSALQLSPDRDPGALRADRESDLDLEVLVQRGLIVGLDPAMLTSPPRIEAETETERAALGYLHANCGHCHNSRGPLANLGLFLRQELLRPRQAVLDSVVGHPVGKPAPGQSADAVDRIEPGHPERSAVFERISSRYPALQMPPLGTVLVDDDAVALVGRWITQLDAEKTNTTEEEHR